MSRFGKYPKKYGREKKENIFSKIFKTNDVRKKNKQPTETKKKE